MKKRNQINANAPVMLTAKERIADDIEAVAAGDQVSPDIEEFGLLTGDCLFSPEPEGRVVIYDPKFPQPEHKPGDGFVIYLPDNGRDPDITEVVRPGRGGNVPPVAHRFKPGKSGNPSGRPKRAPSKLIQGVLDSGDQKYMKLVIRALITKACDGHIQAILAVLELGKSSASGALAPVDEVGPGSLNHRARKP